MKTLLTFIGIVALCSTLFSQQLVTYNTANSGLVSDNVNDICIDANGNKWFATSKGVSRLNGSSWITYDTSNSGLADNYVNAVAVDGQGNKWFGTNKGVSKFDGTSWTTYNSANSGLTAGDYAYPEVVFSIHIDKSGSKWFGGYNGIAKLTGNQWTAYDTASNGVALVLAIAEDSQGSIYYSIETSNYQINGLKKRTGSNSTLYSFSNINVPRILDIAIDKQDHMWAVGTNSGSGSASTFNGTAWTTHLTNDYPYGITADAQGNVWVTNCNPNGSLLHKYDGTNWTSSFQGCGYSGAIAIDNQGNKWVAVADGGVAVLNSILSIDAPLDNYLRVYPNPASGVIDLSGLPLTHGFLTITNLHGEVLASVETNAQETLRIDMSEYPTGLYVIAYTDGETAIYQKLVKD